MFVAFDGGHVGVANAHATDEWRLIEQRDILSFQAGL